MFKIHTNIINAIVTLFICLFVTSTRLNGWTDRNEICKEIDYILGKDIDYILS